MTARVGRSLAWSHHAISPTRCNFPALWPHLNLRATSVVLGGLQGPSGVFRTGSIQGGDTTVLGSISAHRDSQPGKNQLTLNDLPGVEMRLIVDFPSYPNCAESVVYKSLGKTCNP